MKLRHTLLPLALLTALAGPLMADGGKEAPIASAVAALQAPQPRAMTPAQRAETFPAAAFIPPQDGLLLASATGALPRYVLGSTEGSIALSIPHENLETLARVIAAIRAEAGDLWPSSASTRLYIKPCYIVVTLPDEEAGKYENDLRRLLEHGSLLLPEICSPVHVADMSGLRLNLAKLCKPNSPAAYARGDRDSGEASDVAYLLLRRQGNSSIIILCSDPGEIRLAETPEESVLADSAADLADRARRGNPQYIAAVSPAFLRDYERLLGDAQRRNFDALIDAIVHSSWRGDSEAAKRFKQCADKLSAQLMRVAYPMTHAEKPLTVAVWRDGSQQEQSGDWHIDLRSDACGSSFAPAPLRLTSAAGRPETALYVESAPLTLPFLPSAAELTATGEELIDLFLAAQGAQDEAEQARDSSRFDKLRPALTDMIQALATMRSGFSGSAALLLAEHPESPFALNICADLSRHDALTAGARLFDDAAKRTGAALGADSVACSLARLLEPGERSLESPLPGGFVPTLSVSDKLLAFRSHRETPQGAAQADAPAVDFAGAVFCFRPAAIGRIIGRITDSLNACEPAFYAIETVDGRSDELIDENANAAEADAPLLQTETDASAALPEPQPCDTESISGALDISEGYFRLHLIVKPAP